MFIVHKCSNPTPVLIPREGIAKRLDLAEERPPTEEDYFDQLATRFGVKCEKIGTKTNLSYPAY